MLQKLPHSLGLLTATAMKFHAEDAPIEIETAN